MYHIIHITCKEKGKEKMIKIIADSTCDLTNEEAEKLGVQLIPMKVLIDDEEYISGVNLSTEEFYEKLATCKKLPQTTLISDFTYEEIIKEALEREDQVFVMCLSSELSSSFNNLQKVYEEINSPRLEIFDSQSAAFAFKAMVIEAVQLSKKCKTVQELKEKLLKVFGKVRLLAIIDNVKYLIKGGRLSLMKGLAVTALNIKPIVTIKDGKVAVVSKGIGFGNSLKNMLKEVKNIDTTKPVYFGHSNDLQRLDTLKKLAKEGFDVDTTDSTAVGPVIGTHIGPNCVGITYFEK